MPKTITLPSGVRYRTGTRMTDNGLYSRDDIEAVYTSKKTGIKSYRSFSVRKYGFETACEAAIAFNKRGKVKTPKAIKR